MCDSTNLEDARRVLVRQLTLFSKCEIVSSETLKVNKLLRYYNLKMMYEERKRSGWESIVENSRKNTEIISEQMLDIYRR